MTKLKNSMVKDILRSMYPSRRFKVPLFIDKGEIIKIDTRTGEYLSRA